MHKPKTASLQPCIQDIDYVVSYRSFEIMGLSLVSNVVGRSSGNDRTKHQRNVHQDLASVAFVSL